MEKGRILGLALADIDKYTRVLGNSWKTQVLILSSLNEEALIVIKEMLEEKTEPLIRYREDGIISESMSSAISSNLRLIKWVDYFINGVKKAECHKLFMMICMLNSI